MKSREISRSKIGPFSLACTDPYIGIGWEYQSSLVIVIIFPVLYASLPCMILKPAQNAHSLMRGKSEFSFWIPSWTPLTLEGDLTVPYSSCTPVTFVWELLSTQCVTF